jgi:hypothetical protein
MRCQLHPDDLCRLDAAFGQLGQAGSSIVHPDDVGRLQLFRSGSLSDRQGEYKVDYRIVRRDGEVRWIESVALFSSVAILAQDG